MTPEIENVLKETIVEGKNLCQIYSQWVEAGIALGDVERQRIRISEKADENAITLGDVQRSRFLWVRTMSVLTTLIELDPNIPEEIQVQILQPLKKAEERYSRKKSITDTDTDTDTDSEDDDAIPSVG
ncbi:MAG: hypothetical protein JXR76_32850 [Deltaproteobacteria bacterium]|nr:hypothetical protein [Deltaproteobacteria bacterium]